MRPILLSAALLTLAAPAPHALADSMYKCVGAEGKIAYSTQPCEGKARMSRQFSVPPPEKDEERDERLKLELEKLRERDKQFQARKAGREAQDENELRRSAMQRNAANIAAADSRSSAERERVQIRERQVAKRQLLCRESGETFCP